MHRSIHAVILDIDGTLVDSNEAHALSWVRSLKEEGLRFSLDEICPLIGMGGDHLLPELSGITEDSEKGKRISERRKNIFQKEFLPHLRPTRGAEKLLERLRAEGLKLSVASSASRDDLEALLKILHADFLIENKTSKDDANSSKPAPDLVEAALSKIGAFPSETLMLGDTPYDIESALRAGVQTIALRCGGRTDEELRAAAAIYDHPLDLLENFEQSPLGLALISGNEPRSA